MMNTSPRFNVKGNPFEMSSSPTFDAEVQQRMALVEWINSAVPHFYLSVKASEEELRASLLDGDILSQLLQKLKYSSSDEGDDSSPSTPLRRRKIQRFIASMSEMGLPCFEIADLEKGSMKPVLDCLLALKEHTKRQYGSPVYKPGDDRRQALSELKFQRSYSLLSPESPTMLLHGGNKFHEVFQMKQGFYADLPATKISEMIKSNSLDNAPTQSLLSVINGILDESIERKNAEIPQRVACLLRKVVQEIERRIATQGEHLRTQSNLFKSREEKYQSRIKVLETLAKGTSEESEIAMNQLQHIKSEKSKLEEKKRSEQQEMNEKKRVKMKEVEDKKMSEQMEIKETKRSEQQEMEEKKRFEKQELEEKIDVAQKMEEKKRIVDQEADKLKKIREETDVEVSKLKKELEMAKRTHELRFKELETEEKKRFEEYEADKLKKIREETEIEVSKLKQELEMAKRTHELRFMELETEEKKKFAVQEADKLKRIKEETDIEVSKLKQELEMAKKTNELRFKELETEEKKKFAEQEADKLKKIKEETDIEVSKLKQELETAKTTHELRVKELEIEERKRFEEQEAVKLKRIREETDIEVSKLNQELEMAKQTHEMRFKKLETEAKYLTSELEKKLRQQEQLLENSKVQMKELELNSQHKSRTWTKKEHIYEKLVDIQLSGLEDLRRSSVSIKQEVLKTQTTYMQELNHVGAKLKNIAKAAQSYHAVLDENRKLYNELQDLKGNIRVFCRVRPFRPGENKEQSILEDIGQHGELTVSNPAKPKDSQKSFRFNKVYGPMSTQAEVFADTQPLIRTILDGYNVCIYAYGQTGSGKTYTMSGPDNASKEDWGVNYRALDDLFQVSEDRKNFFLYEIGVQMIEIYNEQIRDLLSSDGAQKKLGILTTPQSHGLAVPDASMHPVRSTEDVIELMNIGLANRTVSSTAMNERSSRSHSVVTIHVQGTDLKSGATTHGSLHLVDLAGSERIDRSEVTGDRLKEAQHINKSLSSLGDVIFALAQKSPHVPYRNSKLTQVLQSSLGGRAKTLMFVQVNPDVCSYTESVSTLKFAERVSGVELGAARNNKEGKDVKELADQVASLKDTLAKKDEELDRLLKDPRSPSSSSKRSMSSSMTGSVSPNNNPMKGGPSSPSARSMAGSPRKSALGAAARRPGSLNKSFDSFSDNSDPGSQNSVEDSENDGIRPSRSMTDLKGQKNSPDKQSKRSGGSSMESDMMVLGDGENDDRLSDTSDGDIPPGIDADGTLDGNVSPEGSKSFDASEKRREKPKTPTRLSQSPRAPTGVSRLSQVKTTLRASSALKKPSSGNSSPVTPGSTRRRV